MSELARNAILSYTMRYGKPPAVVQVHPVDVMDVGEVGVVIEASQYIRPAHVLVGEPV